VATTTPRRRQVDFGDSGVPSKIVLIYLLTYLLTCEVVFWIITRPRYWQRFTAPR